MSEDPNLTAVIEAWPNLAPDARRMLGRLAQDCLEPENLGAFRKTACPRVTNPKEGVPAVPGTPRSSGLKWPELRPAPTSSSAWELHDDPEMNR